MRRIFPIFLFACLFSFPVGAQVDPAAPKESVTLDINAELLQRARELNVDLSAFVEERLATALKMESSAPAMSHKALVTASLDTLEDLLMSPLKVDESTPTDSVRAVCGSMLDAIDQLAAYAEIRKSMAEPTTLEEILTLGEYMAGRFRAIQTRAAEVERTAQSSVAILRRDCPNLDQADTRMSEVISVALAPYHPNAWCDAMRQKPQAAWTMDDGTNYAKLCTGGN